MLINKVYKKVNELVNKDQVGGFLAPATFNEFAELAQLDYVFERFNPVTKKGFETTTRLSDEFSELKKSATLPVVNGRITKPADYHHFSAAWTYSVFNDAGSARPARLVRDEEWSMTLSSEIDMPSAHFPVLRNINGFFEVRPYFTPQVQLEYIKAPLIPWWNYTQGSDFIPVFSASAGVTLNPNTNTGASTDFELSETALPYLVYKICAYFGISVRESEVYQMISNEQANEH